MDKKMMDKMNEALKANGKRELSLDEMDKVSGGGKMWEEMSYNDFNDFWLSLASSVGYDSTIRLFNDATGYVTYSDKSNTGVGGGGITTGSVNSDEEKMGVVLREFWGLIDQGGHGYH